MPRRFPIVIVTLLALAAMMIVAWTFDRTTTHLYCDRCAALRETIRYEVLGMSFPGSDSLRATALSTWIESHNGAACAHRWAPGYTDGFWFRPCHRGNRADHYRIWGDDPALVKALDGRQRADSRFIARVVHSLQDRDEESHYFLPAVLFEDLEAQSGRPASETAKP